MDVGATLVAHVEAADVGEPGYGALDDPNVIAWLSRARVSS